MKDTIIAGVDIGGSHITAALIDLSTTKIVNNSVWRKEVNSQGNAEDILSCWSIAIEESFRSANIKTTKIGIAMPGPFDYENGISYIKGQNKFDALYGLNIKERLAEKLKISATSITIVNDAECFIKGEVSGGAGKGFKRVMGLTLGTGLGSAWCLDGKTEDANLWCSKYKDGIAEDYISTRWFMKRYKEISGVVVKDVKELVSKINNNPSVQIVFDEFGNNLANFLIPYIEKEQPQLIVLGGNISLAFSYFSQELKKVFIAKGINIEIKTSELRENASLIGAATYYSLSTFNYSI